MKNKIVFIITILATIHFTACSNGNAETFEYLGESFSVQDAYYKYYDDNGKLSEFSFDNFGYIQTNEGEIKVTLGQEIDGLTAARTDVMFNVNSENELNIIENDIILEGDIELTGLLYKIRQYIAGGLNFIITEPVNGIIPFGTIYQCFFVLGEYNPQKEYPDIFKEAEFAEVTVIFNEIRLLMTSRNGEENYIELTGITSVNN